MKGLKIGSRPLYSYKLSIPAIVLNIIANDCVASQIPLLQAITVVNVEANLSKGEFLRSKEASLINFLRCLYL
ncbi:hypothetical protein GLOTRDRAFT_112776 [Gloeophyllum trabeum ATCC 11539]|uniref:Uncharacterized protein n=1 Tax=Gloeophyllum trabeum (strain ATCC 11539 / FP-39264 / Madison 617) TaxID=670483 RepID=S7PP97_GLOTA|nr:uncharacterized protein GLOTRDRAFT_112776 [Gloeophyllum trabeum ATCC 11539]EPQ49696.1 hypothetical protein GLOTRDRAFT_112776 [Gloeophyllum trabeum ATCC 11539]